MAGLTSTLRAHLPGPVWSVLRSVKDGILRLRFYRGYVPGLLFDLTRRTYVTEGMSFEVPRHLTTRIHRARFYRDTHELDERVLVRKYFPDDATVLELGACLGVVSGVINRRLSDGRRHVAVEANPALSDVLRVNRDANGCSFGIEICMVSRMSEGVFFQNDCLVMSSGHMRQGTEIRVPVKTVEQIEAQSGLRFDTVFMDIQGGELDFLRENPDLLRRTRLVVFELHPHIIGEGACEECRTLLRAAGLQCAEQRGLVEVWTRSQANEDQVR